MRAKDAPRLAVLRSIITASLNASKTANPIRTDVQLVTLLRKSQRSCLDAAEEFKAAGREDLAGKEEEQARIAEEYVAGSGVQVLGEAELKAMVEKAVEAAKAAGVTSKAMIGDVMKRLGEADGWGVRGCPSVYEYGPCGDALYGIACYRFCGGVKIVLRILMRFSAPGPCTPGRLRTGPSRTTTRHGKYWATHYLRVLKRAMASTAARCFLSEVWRPVPGRNGKGGSAFGMTRNS